MREKMPSDGIVLRQKNFGFGSWAWLLDICRRPIGLGGATKPRNCAYITRQQLRTCVAKQENKKRLVPKLTP